MRGQTVIHPDPMANIYIFPRPQTPMTTDVNDSDIATAYVFAGRHLFAFKSQLLQTPPRLPFALVPTRTCIPSLIEPCLS